jgi:hypothetical protein
MLVTAAVVVDISYNPSRKTQNTGQAGAVQKQSVINV